MLSTARIRLRRLVLVGRVAVVVTALLLLANVFVGRARHDFQGNVLMGDFLAHYTGGHFAGTPQLYEIEAQKTFQNDLLGDEGYLDLFISPPWVAWVYAPLARLPLAVAQWLWTGLVALSVFLGWKLLREHTAKTQRHERRLLFLFALSFYPLIDVVASGQDTCLTGIIWALGIHLVLTRRDLLAGLVFGLGVMKPHLFVLPMLYLLIERRFRAILGALISASASISLTGSVAMFRAWLGILQSPGYLEGTRRGHIWKMQSSVATIEGLFPPSLDAIARPIGFVVAGVIGIATLIHAHRAREPRRAWALLVVGSILVSPHLFGYDLALLLIPAVLLLGDRWERSTVRAIIAIDLLLWFGIERSAFAARPFPLSMLAAPLAPIAMLVVWRDIWRARV